MSDTIKYIAKRNSEDEFTVAIMECRLTTGKTDTRERFLSNLKAAVTKWEDTTQDGKLTVSGTGGDFNFGDLSLAIDNERPEKGEDSLRKIMSDFGIWGLEMQVISEQAADFSYDTVLSNK